MVIGYLHEFTLGDDAEVCLRIKRQIFGDLTIKQGVFDLWFANP